MSTSFLSLPLLLALLTGQAPAQAVPSAPAGVSGPASPGARDADARPPLAKEDEALVKAARRVNVELAGAQHTASRLTWRAKESGYEQRLPDLAKSGALPKELADELLSRLLQKWNANLEVVQAPSPVSKLRVCAYPLLHFESTARVGKGTKGAEARMAYSRGVLADCVDRASAVLRAMRSSNEELAAVLADIDRELAPFPAAAPTASPGKKGAPPPAGARRSAAPASAQPD